MSNLAAECVLITGGLGFIGSNLARKCVEMGARVVICDSLEPRAGGNIHNVDDIRSSVTVESIDVRDMNRLGGFIKSSDMVFHCAATTSHSESMLAPFDDLDTNCRGTLCLLEAVRRFNPAARVVSIGTSTQIGKMQVTPVDEDHAEFPLDIYSAHRSLAEKYVLIYARVYGLSASVVRFANVYGPRAHIRTNRFGFMNYFVGLALRDQEVTVFGTGQQLRNVMYVEDCVNALLAAAQSSSSKAQVYFATADEQYAIATIAEEIVQTVGSGSVRSIPWPKEKAALEIGDAVISNQRIKEALGWRPQYDLRAGLAETRDYFRTRLPNYLE